MSTTRSLGSLSETALQLVLCARSDRGQTVRYGMMHSMSEPDEERSQTVARMLEIAKLAGLTGVAFTINVLNPSWPAAIAWMVGAPAVAILLGFRITDEDLRRIQFLRTRKTRR